MHKYAAPLQTPLYRHSLWLTCSCHRYQDFITMVSVRMLMSFQNSLLIINHNKYNMTLINHCYNYQNTHFQLTQHLSLLHARALRSSASSHVFVKLRFHSSFTVTDILRAAVQMFQNGAITLEDAVLRFSSSKLSVTVYKLWKSKCMEKLIVTQRSAS